MFDFKLTYISFMKWKWIYLSKEHFFCKVEMDLLKHKGSLIKSLVTPRCLQDHC